MNHDRINKNVATIAVLVAISLIVIKMVAWINTQSLAVFSSMLDSILDSMISCMNFFAIYYAAAPADDDHSFGHNSIEDIAGLFQAAFISGSTLFIIFEAFQRALSPTSITVDANAIYIMMISTIITAILVFIQLRTIRITKSIVISADLLHYMGDILMNISVVVSLLCVYYIGGEYIQYLDTIMALAISAYILRSAFGIGKRSINNLMDAELPKEERQKIIDIIENHDDVQGYHMLKTRSSGSRKFIQLHLELDGELSLDTAHHISKSLADRIKESFHNAEVIIHEDPTCEEHVMQPH